MGAYINPESETKEQFLEREGKSLPCAPKWSDVPQGYFPVCWVNNRMFTAAGIAYCKKEVEAFAEPDGRVKRWYLVEIKKLHAVSPELEDYMRYPID